MNARPADVHRLEARRRAEEIWREGCFAYLGAVFGGAPLSVIRQYGLALMQARADVLATYRSSTP